MLERIRKTSRDEGFTLIELLIVIIILGILAAIVVFAVGSTRKDSVASSCRTDFKSIELSAEAINTKMGTYPAAGTLNANLIAGNTAGPNSTNNGALLKVYPTSSNYNLVYAQVGTGSSNSFTITVQKPGATAGSWSTVATNPTAADGCDAL
jgi:prepilin-type N-terminal cleavage/methylation domain-containing protein